VEHPRADQDTNAKTYANAAVQAPKRLHARVGEERARDTINNQRKCDPTRRSPLTTVVVVTLYRLDGAHSVRPKGRTRGGAGVAQGGISIGRAVPTSVLRSGGGAALALLQWGRYRLYWNEGGDGPGAGAEKA